jgi:hypothetical protein
MEQFFTPIRRLQERRENNDGNDTDDPFDFTPSQRRQEHNDGNYTHDPFDFTPSQRRQERWENNDGNDVDDPFDYAEFQLTVPVEEFLIYRWDLEDLFAFVYCDGDALRTILWITKDSFLAFDNDFQMIEDFQDYGYALMLHAYSTTTSGQEQMLTIFQDADSALSSGAYSVFWHAIMTSNSAKMRIVNEGSHLPSGPVLSQFLRWSPSLQVLEFHGVLFKEEHCYALATVQRTDLELKLSECTLEPQDAQDMFIEWFQRNPIVTKLDSCCMERSLTAALSKNNSDKSFYLPKRT